MPQGGPTLSINDVTIIEGDSGTSEITFTVTLSPATPEQVSFQFTTAPGTATEAVPGPVTGREDYSRVFGAALFGPGGTTRLITVPVIGELRDEFDETFFIRISNPNNATIADAEGMATILDNDPPPTVSINDVSVNEASCVTTSAVFVASLSLASGKPISVDFATANATAIAGNDYVAASGTVVFNPEESAKQISVEVIADTANENEPDETFSVNLSNLTNVTVGDGQGVGTIVNFVPPIVQFGASSHTIGEASPRIDITVGRSGDTRCPTSVSFTTNDAAGLQNCNVFNGTASPRCDFINTLGTLTFAAAEASKSFSVAIVDDSYAEGNETFTIGLDNASGASLGTQSQATVNITDNESANGPNPIDDTNFFVRQQYLDFLGREPDPPGFAGWVNTINNCPPGDTTCDRIHVSQLFFQSAEFQQRGYFVYRFYPVSFGRKPDYAEFVPDLAQVSGFLSDAQLEAAKVAFIADFMTQTAFVGQYNGLNNTQYVDSLLNTAGVTLSSRQAMIDGLNAGTLTRAQVLRQIVESGEVAASYFNQAYAVMEYFGYLRRQPDAFYLDWIRFLDQSNDPRGMVNGFVNSIEYRQRFGP